ncbi:MAG: membrane-bound lytic murein transglycosylase MltF [Nevskiales bacterium]
MRKNDNFKGTLRKVTATQSARLGQGLLAAIRRLLGQYREFAAPLSRFLRDLHRRMTPANWIRLAAGLTLGLVLGTCSPPVSLLDQVRQSGTLKVATFNSGTTYYQTALGPTVGATGFEYDLAKLFAEELGVELEIVVVSNPQEALDALRGGRVHLAAGLTRTPGRERLAHFGPDIMSVTSELVYRVGRERPEALEQVDAPILIPQGSSDVEKLEALKKAHPRLRLKELPDIDSEGLLSQVAESETAFTVADSRLISINSRYFPQLRVAFVLGEPEMLAWAMPPDVDDGFQAEVDSFFKHIREDTELDRLTDRHFGYKENEGYVGGQTFAKQAESVLPVYRKVFEQAGEENSLDWRLLAAMGYQESHWNPGAVSPTGVRGLMMLTEATARFIGVNRLDAHQSIHGGARYMKYIYGQLPNSIPEPDRTWMALASYNQGWGAVLDARNITKMWGGEPDRWVDVRKSLLLLTQAKWHQHTKYGYARGYEAVGYVNNIRSYYDILVWMTSGENLPPPEELSEPPTLEEKYPSKALEIESPIL